MPDLHAWITQQVDECEQYARTEILNPVNALRRCEADRRILARHTLDPDVHYEPACEGCGTYGDLELSVTDNLNECPELLDLAYAHGLTDDILATLDQPEPPARPEQPEVRPGFLMPDAIRESLASFWSGTQMANVPPALRGPNWRTA